MSRLKTPDELSPEEHHAYIRRNGSGGTRPRTDDPAPPTDDELVVAGWARPLRANAEMRPIEDDRSVDDHLEDVAPPETRQVRELQSLQLELTDLRSHARVGATQRIPTVKRQIRDLKRELGRPLTDDDRGNA